MIIGPKPHIYPAEAFPRGMQRAIRGVVRVLSGDSFKVWSTGWLLTPHLVVVANVTADGPAENTPIRIQGSTGWTDDGFEPVETLRFPGTTDEPKPSVALVRLKKPHSGRLDLALSTPEPQDFAVLLHFPLGAPALSVSFGRVEAVDDLWVDHVADSQPGSSGAPLFDANWRLIGVQCMGGRVVNKALNRGMLLRMLQATTAWEEIARHHKLADTAAGAKRLADDPVPTQSPDDLVVAAALCSNFDPGRLSPADRETLQAKVVDSTEKRWTLSTRVRQEALRTVERFADLKNKLPSWRTKNDAQRVIDRILEGPPYDLSKVSDESLPWWIQTSQWFAGIAPELPTSTQVTRILERRRVRGRLEMLAGSDFQGREEQQKIFNEWFAKSPPRPLVISGIGGMGKTALVAHCILNLPPETFILWLDFDRADLAPDNAVSIMGAIIEQAKIQLDGFEAPAVSEVWHPAAEALGKQLAACLAGSPAPILVLDSFEVAQYADKYQELWPLLETIVACVPDFRVVVSGRAPVEKLEFAGQEAQQLALPGLSGDEVRKWLHKHKIEQPELEEQLVGLAKGIPLIVRLTFQLVEAGEAIDDLPKDLPLKIVPGYLYRRILGRVQPKFRDVAKAAIILPRMTEEMVTTVVSGLLPLPDEPVAKWFPELRKETALVTGTDILKVREEVRSAALYLLEVENKDLVKSIEENAERWLSQQDVKNPEIAAEIVYLRLRLGNLRGAGRAWRDGCGAFLKHAPDVLKDNARKWLETRLGGAPPDDSVVSIEPREEETAERVRDMRARGLYRGIGQVLKEVSKRSDNSPLVFHDAYEAQMAPEDALALLDEAGPGQGRVGRDRAVLRALLLAKSGDRHEADHILAEYDAPEHWTDRSELERLAVTAARIRLNTDLDLEMDGMESTAIAPIDVLSPVDVILPKLQKQLNLSTSESVTHLEIPESANELDFFRVQIERVRKGRLSPAKSPIGGKDLRVTLRLVENADRRWAIVTGSTFLADALRALGPSMSGGAVALGVRGSVHLYVGDLGGLILIPPRRIKPASFDPTEMFLTRITPRLFQIGLNPRATIPVSDEIALFDWTGSRVPDREIWILSHVSSPDPLETLVDALAGQPS